MIQLTLSILAIVAFFSLNYVEPPISWVANFFVGVGLGMALAGSFLMLRR